MTANLDSVPIELAAIIGRYLDVASLCSLRLVSNSAKRLFALAYQPHIQHLGADLTKFSLERLCELSANTDLSSAVHSLTLTYLYDPAQLRHPDSLQGEAEWPAEQRSEKRRFPGQLMCTLLITALPGLPNLRNFALEASFATYNGDRQDVNIVHSFAWRDQWPRAFQTLHALLVAITYSGVHLDGLAIFQNCRKCSIPTHAVTMSLVQRLETEGFAAVGSRLKAFTIALAMTPQPPKPDEDTLEGRGSKEAIESRGIHSLSLNNSEANSEAEFGGISSLLRLMPNLQSLKIHLYPGIFDGPDTSYHPFLPTVFKDKWHFSRLKELKLLGLLLTTRALQDIVLRHVATLQDLDLEYVVLASGSWNPIFITLSQQANSLVNLRLSLLGVGQNMEGVNLEPVDQQLDPLDDSKRSEVHFLGPDGYYWSTRCIEADEIRGGLNFRPKELMEGFSCLDGVRLFYVLNY